MSAPSAEQDEVLERVHRRLFAGAVPDDISWGRYEILEKIGEGGMGVVWLARDPKLDRTLALKVVRTASPRTHARLLAEGRALARVSHPNVVQIFEVVESEGQVALAMEYVQGRTLLEWARGAAWPAILEVLVQAGRGLAAAHARGIAHRDFKPDNVLVDAEGRARVVDFGLARDVEQGTGESQLLVTPGGDPVEPTQTGAIHGTPAYMSPEQSEGKRGDARSDQYSFCVTAFEALCGARPISGFGDELRRNVIAGRRSPPPADSSAPASLLAVLDRGLAVDPAVRWPDMSALLAALEDAPRRPLAVKVFAALVAVAFVARVVVLPLGFSDGIVHGTQVLIATGLLYRAEPARVAALMFGVFAVLRGLPQIVVMLLIIAESGVDGALALALVEGALNFGLGSFSLIALNSPEVRQWIGGAPGR